MRFRNLPHPACGPYRPMKMRHMGFFKSKTLIRGPDLLSKIIDKVIENSSTIHEVSLAALLKVLRYSLKLHNDEKLLLLLDTLQHEVHRLSVMSCIHLALCGTSTLTLHKQCLDQITKHVSSKLSKARLKDLERLALTCCMFNYKPADSEMLFDSIVKELGNPDRETEISFHGRSFACCLSFLAMLEICPVDLINKALDPEFLERTYGKSPILYGREILHLNNLSLIYFEDSVSNKLSKKHALIMAKKYTDFVPDKNYQKQYNVTEKMMLDVITTLKEGRGDSYVLGQHILTHHQRGDIIVCNDKDGNARPVDVFPTNFGPMHRPPDENNWIALVIAGRNTMIKSSNDVTGPFVSKVRDLQTLGYKANIVNYNKWIELKTPQEKLDYLESLIRECK